MKGAGLFTMCVATIALVILGPTAGGQQGQEAAPDMLKVCGKNCTVKLDNKQFRVTEVVMPNGYKLPMHFHPCPFIWWDSVGGGHLMVSLPGGKTESIQSKRSEVAYSDAATHAIENVGTSQWRSL